MYISSGLQSCSISTHLRLHVSQSSGLHRLFSVLSVSPCTFVLACSLHSLYSLFSLLQSLHTILYLHPSPLVSTVSLVYFSLCYSIQFYICMYISQWCSQGRCSGDLSTPLCSWISCAIQHPLRYPKPSATIIQLRRQTETYPIPKFGRISWL